MEKPVTKGIHELPAREGCACAPDTDENAWTTLGWTLRGVMKRLKESREKGAERTEPPGPKSFREETPETGNARAERVERREPVDAPSRERGMQWRQK
jgi:hypothetical protein